MVNIGERVPGAARLVLHGDGVALLHPQEQVFAAMLDGWRNQQLARRLALATVSARQAQVRQFADHAQTYPWLWTAQLAPFYCKEGALGRREGGRSVLVAGPGSDFSEAPMLGLESAALEPVVAPVCPPGLACSLTRSAAIVTVGWASASWRSWR